MLLKMVMLSLLLLLLAINSASSAKIAGFAAVGGSGYINMRNIMEELASRGHEVALVVPSSRKLKTTDRLPLKSHKIYQVPYKPGFEEEMIRLDIEGRTFQFFMKMNEVLSTLCESILNSTEILKELEGFDLIIYDGISNGALLIGEKFDIPRVEILPDPPNVPFGGFAHMIPMPVSYVPQLITEFSNEMTFVERVLNLGAYLVSKLGVSLLSYRKMDALKVKYNIKPERSFEEALADAKMVIIGADFAVEYPQPLLPGQVMVGALNVKTAKPLPPELEKFVSASGERGFIIVSFGTNVASLPKAEVDMLAEAFGKLKQRVIWKVRGYIPSSLSPNIKALEWLPQNDLLGHKNIKAFVSHVGHNSLYESAYHGVPVVAFPLFGDQYSNAKKISHLGLGLSVHHRTTSVQQVVETIETVVSEPRFKSNAMHISSLLKDRRRAPLQETADWIEYVLRHGGARHLRAQVFNIPWYQYYLLDVIAFLVAMITLAVTVIRLACHCIRRLCCKKDSDKAKKE
ncbi:unnamed protein product [Porites evermanni]|uniref:UDP-glucuronosyltransferase n=1 Tax=Porites evermanni TaxID=104178 RepID=A0ABN8SCF7_9CNID|nr:unnamed protein product [Porites evermanni]